jgi:N-acetyl-1-D-myo-inositol-2-amino-2-deoxy-alpha-D-glucopyranoside deacetylase
MSLPAAGPRVAPDEGAPIGGLLAVHAHPDDETLATGALLATWAAAGLPVTVVTATRGERGEVIPPALRHLEGDGPALAAHRSGELAAALAALGVTEHAFLDTLPDPATPGAQVTREAHDEPFPSQGSHLRRDRAYEDSGMVWLGTARAGAATDIPAGAFVGVPLDEAAGRLAALLRARRPALVVTYDPEGGYGHPDHVRVHEVTMRAAELAAGDGWQPAVWWRRTGRSALAAAYRALPTVRSAPGGPSDELAPDPEGPFPAVAVPDEALDVLVDVAPVRDRVLAALRAHATQVHGVRAVEGEPALLGCYALSDRVLQPLLRDEGYVQVRGPRLSGPAGVRQLP